MPFRSQMMQACRSKVWQTAYQLLLWTSLWRLPSGAATIVPPASAVQQLAWQHNDELYANAQYDKMLGQPDCPAGSPCRDQQNSFQLQYVDYQPKCGSGGQPVCATNGTNFFYFENDCKLEAANMKMLFEYSTELEPTELERCLPQCDNMRCTTTYAPVCAAAGEGPAVTFGNECEAHRRGCLTKQVMRILKKGPCGQAKVKAKLKTKVKRRRKLGKRLLSSGSSSNSTGSATRDIELHPMACNTSTTASSTASPTASPEAMRFQQFVHCNNPDVFISQAVHPYSVYNIPDIGVNYAAITDSSLSVYVPGVGTVTDTPPSTTTTTTTTTTARPTTTEKEEIKFFYLPFITPSSSSTPSPTLSIPPTIPIIPSTTSSPALRIVPNPTIPIVPSTTSSPALRIVPNPTISIVPSTTSSPTLRIAPSITFSPTLRNVPNPNLRIAPNASSLTSSLTPSLNSSLTPSLTSSLNSSLTSITTPRSSSSSTTSSTTPRSSSSSTTRRTIHSTSTSTTPIPSTNVATSTATSSTSTSTSSSTSSSTARPSFSVAATTARTVKSPPATTAKLELRQVVLSATERSASSTTSPRPATARPLPKPAIVEKLK